MSAEDKILNAGYIEAMEWIDYNTIRALPCIDNRTDGKAPIITYPIDW